jgi:hypothetical protein
MPQGLWPGHCPLSNPGAAAHPRNWLKSGTSDWLSRRAELGFRNCFFFLAELGSPWRSSDPEVKTADKAAFFWPWVVFSYFVHHAQII